MTSPLTIKKTLITFILIFGFSSIIIPIVHGQEHHIATIDSFIRKANKFIDQNQYDSAFTLYDSALKIAQQTKNEAKISQIQNLRGEYFRHFRKNDQAYNSYSKARKIAQNLKNDTLSAMADIGLGHVYEEHGSLDSAEYFYNHALTNYENSKDSLGIGLGLLHLSMFYQTKIDYEKSLLYALESYRIYKKYNPDHKYYIWSLMNLGNIYLTLKEYDTALSCYNQCYNLSIQKNNISLANQAAVNKAAIYYYHKEYRKSREEYLKMLPFNEKNNDTKELSILYSNISIMDKHLGNLDEALNYAGKAVELAKKSKSKEMEIGALLNLALVYKQKKNYANAEKYNIKSINLAKKYGYLGSLKTGYNNLALLYKLMGKYQKGYEYLSKYNEVSDSINNQEKIRAREKYKAKYELLHLQDQNRINELQNKKVIFQRNVTLIVGLLVIILLIIILVMFRMRAKKNRVIAAQKIQQLEDEKKLMAAQSILIGQEKERERIARELHDGIGVLLSTASIHFSSIESKTDKETSEMLKKANKLLKNASKEVRQISHNMMPGVLSKFGLQEAIEDLFEDVEDAGNLQVNLDIALRGERLPENMEIMIYRIVQEMLNNTLKHAQASVVSMSLTKEEDTITIEFKDNGHGFEEDHLPKDKNLGLLGIRTRVEFLGGTVEIKSKTGQGTAFKIIIPANSKAE